MPRSENEKNIYLHVKTPLDGDFRKFWLEDIEGEEHISGLFHYRLRLTSDDAEPVNFKKILGKPVTVTIELHEGAKRYINGIVTQFIQAESGKIHTTYYADIRPWLWQCTLTTDCRIFQNQNVPDIISAVFKGLGFTDFKINLKKSYNKRVYCVQYNETAFNFVSRLMEEEGIFYFFEHTEEIHTLVLADDTDAHQVCIEKAKFLYVEPDHETEDTISNCTIEEQLVPNKYASRDYNFETPNTRLMSSVDAKQTGKFRVYTYPGIYGKTDDGDKISDNRIESYELPSKILRGQGFCRAFTAGYKFNLTEHKRPDFNIAYVLSGVFIHATPERYFNHFEAFPADVPYRPLRISPKPRIYSSQTAVVVGKAGEEIWTDKYGRIKVQFHWDELGKKDENSSCWMRVAQIWAGKSWGSIFIPRIGMEVIVNFLEGDPDQPIITGTVYNASQTVPYSLPDEKTKSTIKSDSSLGGGGFNEIRFEDKKGQEQVFIHAERNKDIRVEKDTFEWVGEERHLVVNTNQMEEVKADKSLTVGGDQFEKIASNSNLNVGGNYNVSVGGDYNFSVGKQWSFNTKGPFHFDIGANFNLNVAAKVSFKIGSFHQECGEYIACSKKIFLNSTSDLKIKAGGKITLEAGGSFITIDSSGVSIVGAKVSMNSGGSPGADSSCATVVPKAPCGPDGGLLPKLADIAKAGLKQDAVQAAMAAILSQGAKDSSAFIEQCNAQGGTAQAA